LANFSVRKLGAFDAGGRGNAFDGSGPAQGGETLRSQSAKRTSSTFELIQLCNEGEGLGW
jgi:hypothetical protein